MSKILLILFFIYILLYFLGLWLAPRNRLKKVNCLVCLGGGRKDIDIIHNRVKTAVKLYQEDWADKIIFSALFALEVPNHKRIPPDNNLIDEAVAAQRIDEQYGQYLKKSADFGLGADYMREKAIEFGVPADKIILEDKSFQTRENAEFTLGILKSNNWHSLILVTSPFHQRRAYLTFKKVMGKAGIKIYNFAADDNHWPRYWWFLKLNNIRLFFGELRRMLKYLIKGDV